METASHAWWFFDENHWMESMCRVAEAPRDTFSYWFYTKSGKHDLASELL